MEEANGINKENQKIEDSNIEYEKANDNISSITNNLSNTGINNKISRILYFIVMPHESDCLIKELNFTKENEFSSKFSNLLESYILKDTVSNFEVIIARPVNDPHFNDFLIGTEIAFTISYLAIQHYKPDIIINMGYAGNTGLIKELEIGSVVIARDFSVYHRREMILDLCKNVSEGKYPLLKVSNLVKDLNFHEGFVGTSNSFLKHDEIAFNKGIAAVEMEFNSVNRAAHYFNTPCLGVKVISDGVEDESLDEKARENRFIESLEILQKTLYETFRKLNNYLLGKELCSL